MPMFKIYVGNLDQRVKIEQIRELFAPFATIEDAVLATDAKTGKAKGFAIVMVRDPEIGRAAVKATQGKRLLGKTLTINEVVKKGKAAAKAAKEVRQGPFGPHFNRQSTGRAGGGGGGGFRSAGGARRGMNRGPRGPAMGGGSSGSGPGGSRPAGSDAGSSSGFRSGTGGTQGFSRGIDRPDAPRARPSDGRPGDIPPRRMTDEEPGS
jgi:RNA recognition motif-containing protein